MEQNIREIKKESLSLHLLDTAFKTSVKGFSAKRLGSAEHWSCFSPRCSLNLQRDSDTATGWVRLPNPTCNRMLNLPKSNLYITQHLMAEIEWRWEEGLLFPPNNNIWPLGPPGVNVISTSFALPNTSASIKSQRKPIPPDNPGKKVETPK